MSKMATREAYGNALAELVQSNENVIVLDADLTKSTKTIDAKNVCPERHFNMGIAEGNMMSVAAGLAASGKIVYASSFAMFAAGRAFEQIRNSIAYPHLNVKICATHAGLTVGEDGASHQCIEDIALMSAIPGMRVYQPCDEKETKAVIKHVSKIDGPCYIRLGRCAVESVHENSYEYFDGKIDILRKGEKIALLATGIEVQEALKAANNLEKEGLKITVANVSCIKPIDEETVLKIAKQHDILITCEEHNYYGGLGSIVSLLLARYCPMKMDMIAIQDTFGESGKPIELLEKYGLGANSIVNVIKRHLE